LNVPVLVGTSEGERNFLGVHKIRGRSILTPRGDADIDRQNSSRLNRSP